MDPILLSVVVPAIMDLLKGGFNAVGRKFAGLSVEDQIKLDQNTISKLEAIAKLDNPYGTPSQWVIDTRASFRYIAAGLLIIGGGCLVLYGIANTNQEAIQLGVETAGAPFGFIFGERMWNNFTSVKAK